MPYQQPRYLLGKTMPVRVPIPLLDEVREYIRTRDRAIVKKLIDDFRLEVMEVKELVQTHSSTDVLDVDEPPKPVPSQRCNAKNNTRKNAKRKRR